MTDIIEIIQPESVVVEVAEAVGPRGPKGNPGPPGERGPAGEPGAKGEPGVGVPTGGTVGEVLVKKSGTDFDAEWAPAGVVSVNGKTGVVTLDASDVGALPDDYTPAWPDVEGKPDVFPPAAHTHPVSDISGLADVAVSGDYGDLDGKPVIPSAPEDIGAQPAGDYVTGTDPRLSDAREPLPHTHPIDDVTGLDQALAGKADMGDVFSGDYDDLTNKPDLFDPSVGSDGDVLTTVSGEWVAAPATGGDGLPPVGTDGDVLTTVNGEWAAAAPTGGGADIPPGTDPGDVLTWDGTEWAGQPPSGGTGAVDSVNGKTGHVTLTASDVGAIASPTINKIVTTTDPEQEAGEGELLVLLPAPRVIAAAWSEQSYGDGDSVMSVTVPVPVQAREGDLILALVGSRALPSINGFGQVATQDGPRTQFATGLSRATVFERTATDIDAGTDVTVTQPDSGRMSIVLLVVRGPNGVAVEDYATDVYAASSTIPGLHPIPDVTATGRGMVAVTFGTCALASSGATVVAVPEKWELITPESAPNEPSHAQNRSWVAIKRLADAETTTGVIEHGPHGGHDGGHITLLLGAS